MYITLIFMALFMLIFYNKGFFTFTGKVQYELDLVSWVLFCFVRDVLLLLLGSSTSHTPSHCSIMPMNSLCPCLVCGFTCLSFLCSAVAVVFCHLHTFLLLLNSLHTKQQLCE